MSFVKSILEGYLPFTRNNLPIIASPHGRAETQENWANVFEAFLALQRKDDLLDVDISTINTTIAGLGSFTPVYGSLCYTAGGSHSAGTNFLLADGTGTTRHDSTSAHVSFPGGANAGQITVLLDGIYVFIASGNFTPVATTGAAGSTELTLAACKNGVALGQQSGRMTRHGVPTHVSIVTGNVDTWTAITPETTLTTFCITSAVVNDVFKGLVTIGAGFGVDTHDSFVGVFRIG